MKLTVGICTKDRGVFLRECLERIAEYSEWVSTVIVVEDISHSQSFSQEELEKIFESSKNTQCLYFSVSFSRIAESRQFLLERAKDDLLLFLDDDVLVGQNALEKAHRFFQKHPQAGLVTGAMVPLIPQNAFSRIDSLYFNQGFMQLGKNRRLTMCPFSFVVLNMKYLRQHKISLFFDSRFKIGEDIDFSLRLSQQSVSIYFEPQIINTHRFDTTAWSYWSKKYEHGQYMYLLFAQYGSAYLSPVEVTIPASPFLFLRWLFRSVRWKTRYYVLLGQVSLMEELYIFIAELATLSGFLRGRFLFSREYK